MNYFLLGCSFHLSRWIKKPVHWGLPAALSIEPTTACNLSCPQCPSGLKQFSRPTGNLKDDTFEALLAQTKHHLHYLTFYFQGEPYIHPKINAYIRRAVDAGIFTATSTNGHFLNPTQCQAIIDSGLHQLIVSVDGADQESYASYRVGGDLQKVQSGIKTLLALKRQRKSRFPQVILQWIVFKTNEHQIAQIKTWAMEAGVDELRLKSAQIYDAQGIENLLPEHEEYARYAKGKDGRFHLKNRLANHCWRMWSSSVITWDGKLVPCCFDKDAKYALGHIGKQSIAEIWKSEAMQWFRAKVLNQRSAIDICSNCSEGSKVWL